MKIFTLNNARFTVIENGVIRMEYAENGEFVDQPTLFAVRDYMYDDTACEAATEKSSDSIIIGTPLIKLTYKDNGRSFSRNNLTARLKIDGKEIYWYPAKKNKENLGGAISTLDGCDGERPLPDGLIARDGWHMIDDSGTTLLYDECRVSGSSGGTTLPCDGWIRERSKAHKADYYLFVYGNDYKGALKSFARVSGKAALPRKYTFGSWYSRWHPYTAEDFREIASGYDENDFPLDILVIDMDWHHHDWQTPGDDPHRTKYGFGHAGGNMGWTGYSWNKKLIPDPAGLLKDMKDRGLYITLNDHPADGIRSNEDCYNAFADMMGLDKEKGENIPYLPGDRKYMDAFFKCALEPNERMGVDFWWVDWQQDYIIPHVPGVKSQKVLPWLNYLYYHHSRKDGKRGASYSRWGGWGDHKHPMFFSGDTVTTWNALEFEIAMTVSSANAMCFWWGHDIGGFAAIESKREPEMYARWVQFGITTAALKIHSCWDDKMDRRPWVWDKLCCDVIREMYHLRSRLLPAIYSAAYMSYKNDAPFIEPLYYEYPDNEEAYHHRCEYLIGRGILCAPIFRPGEGEDCVVEQDVWLPDGLWYNFFSGERREGTVTEKCDIWTFPMYVKAGMPLPMQPYRSRMTTAPLTELRIRIYEPPIGCDESFELYEDDGVTEKYMNGGYLITSIRCRREGSRVTVTLDPAGDGYDGMPEMRDIVLEICTGCEIITEDKTEKADKLTLIRRTASSVSKVKFEFDMK